MSDPKTELSGMMRQIVDDAFNQGAATSLRVARDGLVKACALRPENALTAHEITMIMNDLIGVTTKGKK